MEKKKKSKRSTRIKKAQMWLTLGYFRGYSCYMRWELGPRLALNIEGAAVSSSPATDVQQRLSVVSSVGFGHSPLMPKLWEPVEMCLFM